MLGSDWRSLETGSTPESDLKIGWSLIVEIKTKFEMTRS